MREGGERGAGSLGDFAVGKARPGPRAQGALPEHPAEVAVPREPLGRDGGR